MTLYPIPDYYRLYPEAVAAIKLALQRVEDGETGYDSAFDAILEIISDLREPT